MALKERLQQDMQKAAKGRDPLALSALRMALAAIKNREIEARGPLSDEAIVRVLGSMVKQRREAIELYQRGNRPDLAEKEQREIEVLSAYLPAGLSEAEIERMAREVIEASSASGLQDVGRVMKELMPRVAGRADGKVVGEIVRRLLSAGR